MELNDFRKIICLRKSEVYVKKKNNNFLCHWKIFGAWYTLSAMLQYKMKSQIFHHRNYDITLMSKWRPLDDILPRGLVNIW